MERLWSFRYYCRHWLWNSGSDILTGNNEFTFNNVLPGKYKLIALKGTNYGVIKDIELKDGQSLSDIELALPDETRTLSGRIPNYMPSNASSYLSYDSIIAVGEYIAFGKIYADGTFKLTIPPGKYKLHRLGPHLVCNNTRDNVKPLEVVIEEGKDLEGIELNAEQ